MFNIRYLGLQNYSVILAKMQDFTAARSANSLDEIWLLEHEAVFTQGQAGKAKHILRESEIPIIQSDRGGQVTYHGPGQLIVYLLIDLKRRKFTIRNLVDLIENSIVSLLGKYNIEASNSRNFPGVYVNKEKICFLGLRVKKGCSYHGLSLNVNMDLTPFQDINPCGYNKLKVTQLANVGGPTDLTVISKDLIEQLSEKLS